MRVVAMKLRLPSFRTDARTRHKSDVNSTPSKHVSVDWEGFNQLSITLPLDSFKL
jgi:hypothetical protein